MSEAETRFPINPHRAKASAAKHLDPTVPFNTVKMVNVH